MSLRNSLTKISKQEVKFAVLSGWRPALSHHGDLGGSVKCARNSKIKMKKAVKIGAWNVRGANQQGKVQIVVEPMAKQGISILGMTETFWKGDTSYQMRAATLLY